MKLKLDETGHVVVKDGFPVWVADDGKELAYDVPKLVGDLSRVNAESAGRRKELDGLNAKLRLFDGLDPEKARSALETVANLDAGKLLDAGKVDALRAEIKKAYDGKVSDLEKALANTQKEAADKLAARDASIRNLLVKGIFDSSAFLKDKTVLPPDVCHTSATGRLRREDGSAGGERSALLPSGLAICGLLVYGSSFIEAHSGSGPGCPAMRYGAFFVVFRSWGRGRRQAGLQGLGRCGRSQPFWRIEKWLTSA